jgi:hypothetical protein
MRESGLFDLMKLSLKSLRNGNFDLRAATSLSDIALWDTSAGSFVSPERAASSLMLSRVLLMEKLCSSGLSSEGIPVVVFRSNSLTIGTEFEDCWVGGRNHKL